ncbi:MAG: hypothetical protein ACTH5M_02725 [Psychrobacter sp.]|uniref:hypothetical protein n=1 Tax=Psychrobacter sp. AOP7-B1-24 TaxID=3457645 RepID=UPI003FB6F79E
MSHAKLYGSIISLRFFFSFALLGFATNTSAADSVMDILKPYYPLYNEALQCHGAIAPSGSVSGLTREPDTAGYCIDIDRQKVVETDKGKRLYILVTGDVSFDENGDEVLRGHADSGLVGMFVLKPKGRGWQIESANPYMNAGNYGLGLGGWDLEKFAPNTWGFVNEHSDTHQGYTSTSYVVLTPKGHGIIENWIGAGFDSEGSDSCGGQGQRLCNDRTANLDIDTSKTVNGFYTLKLTVDGYNKGKNYKDSAYYIKYQKDKGYQETKDYPLKDIY